MQNDKTTTRSIPRSLRRGAGVTALAVAFTLASSAVSHAQTVTPPSVPADLEVLPPNQAFLVGHAFGSQNYECQPSASLGRVAWTLFTPQAKATGMATVDPTAIAWVRLEVVGARRGPTGGDELSESTYVQRVNTQGGLAPTTGCDLLNDVGRRAFVPYTADYFFYRAN